MEQIASLLEDAGYDTFLPQRDGLELSKCVECLVREGTALDEAGMLMSQAIFALDVYQVLRGCQSLVANLNGRVPDEGTVSEAAMAWARGKPVVGYKADSRTAFEGRDNPLVAGLFAFSLCDSIEGLVAAVKESFESQASADSMRDDREREISGYLDLGEKLSATLEGNRQIEEVVKIVLTFHFSEAADEPHLADRPHFAGGLNLLEKAPTEG